MLNFIFRNSCARIEENQRNKHNTNTIASKTDGQLNDSNVYKKATNIIDRDF